MEKKIDNEQIGLHRKETWGRRDSQRGRESHVGWGSGLNSTRRIPGELLGLK